MQYRTRGTNGVGAPEGAASSVPSTNSGDFICDRCELKSAFHGAGGSADADGVVADMLWTRRVRRAAVRDEAMVADLDVVVVVVLIQGMERICNFVPTSLPKSDVVITQPVHHAFCAIMQIQ